MHVQSVQNYCFLLSNMQIYDVLVAIVVVVAEAPYSLRSDDVKFLYFRFWRQPRAPSIKSFIVFHNSKTIRAK